MNEMNIWFRFVLAVLATWRMTHLLAREDGPFDLITRLRNGLGEGFIGRLIDCFQCLSLWLAVPMALFVAREPIDFLMAWLALSGATCLLEGIAQEAVVMQPILETIERETNHGMLRTETGNLAEKRPSETEAGGHPICQESSNAD